MFPVAVDDAIVAMWWAAAAITTATAVALAAECVTHPALVSLSLWGKNKTWHAAGKNDAGRGLDVPKQWFLHFYVVGFICNLLLLFVVLYMYIFGQELQSTVKMSFFVGPTRYVRYNLTRTCLALLLMVIQCARRLYETLYMTTASSAKMHVGQYIVGLCFYLGAGFAIVSQSPAAAEYPTMTAPLTILDAYISGIGVLLFVWASWHQYRCHDILYKLRLSPHAKRYSIAKGDWFEYCSSPHYLAEIIIYIAIGTTLGWQCTAWMPLLLFVTSNLGWGAHVTHKNYLANFKDYPKDRAALIPGVW